MRRTRLLCQNVTNEGARKQDSLGPYLLSPLFNYPYAPIEMCSCFYSFYREFTFEKRGFIFLLLDKKIKY